MSKDPASPCADTPVAACTRYRPRFKERGRWHHDAMRDPAPGDGDDAVDDGDYELLDAAEGRRVERFGPYVTDRPSGAAPGWEALSPDLPPANLVFERTDTGGSWVRGGDLPPWLVRHEGLTLELRPAAGGQVGLFPEHAARWPWLVDAVTGTESRLDQAPVVLSLFAYTGGATLALARAGASVVHVDASRPAVAWARTNAAHSGLADASIRWLVEDAAAFVGRERRRGRRYDGVVLDPPSYGHGAGGRAWRIATDLPPLLDDLAAIVPEPALLLLTAHTLGWDAARLGRLLGRAFAVDAEGGALELQSRTGRTLRLGAYAAWTA